MLVYKFKDKSAFIFDKTSVPLKVNICLFRQLNVDFFFPLQNITISFFLTIKNIFIKIAWFKELQVWYVTLDITLSC